MQISHISTTVYCQVFIYTAEWTGASMEWTKMPNCRNGNKGGFEPGLTWLRVRHSITELPRSVCCWTLRTWRMYIGLFVLLRTCVVGRYEHDLCILVYSYCWGRVLLDVTNMTYVYWSIRIVEDVFCWTLRTWRMYIGLFVLLRTCVVGRYEHDVCILVYSYCWGRVLLDVTRLWVFNVA